MGVGILHYAKLLLHAAMNCGCRAEAEHWWRDQSGEFWDELEPGMPGSLNKMTPRRAKAVMLGSAEATFEQDSGGPPEDRIREEKHSEVALVSGHCFHGFPPLNP